MLGQFGKEDAHLADLLRIDLDLPTLDEVDVFEKVVLVRADLNLPIRNGKAEDTTRLELFARTTLKELLEKGAKPVLLTHQGRKGEEDFTTTELHARLLSKFMGRKATYVPSLYGKEVEKEIRELKKGNREILVLENTRFYDEETKPLTFEEHSKSKMVRFLSGICDVFVNDAFASSHRNHASLVGFPLVMPSFIGRIMEWELRVIKYVLTQDNSRTLYILGGSKVEESLDVASHVLEKGLGKVVVGGRVANSFLGFGKDEEVIKAKQLEGNPNLYVPIDYVVGRQTLYREEVTTPPLDLGSSSINRIKEMVFESSQVFFNGPLGYFEGGYIKASKEVLEAIANSPCFSVAGGGHTITLLNKLGMFDKINHVSTGGRALMNALIEKPLPALEAIKLARN